MLGVIVAATHFLEMDPPFVVLTEAVPKECVGRRQPEVPRHEQREEEECLQRMRALSWLVVHGAPNVGDTREGVGSTCRIKKPEDCDSGDGRSARLTE